MTSPELILASASPRRRELLEKASVAFRILPADVEEHEEGHDDPEGMVLHNARLKAAWVADRHASAFVLGSDTTVHLDGRVLVKPADLDDARRMLKTLSGRTHTVYTGVALVCRERGVDEVFGVRSSVAFKALDDALIDRYFAIVDPLDKAGAYGIQEGKELIIAGYQGSFTNIMGLPMDETLEALRRHRLA